MLGDEGLLQRDDLVRAVVGVERRLNIGEEDDGAVSTSADKLAASLSRRRECDGVVEGQAE